MQIRRKEPFSGTISIVLIFGALMLPAGCAQQVESRAGGQKVEFVEVASGQQAGFVTSSDKPGYLLVADAGTWQKIARSVGLDSVPAIDFSSERVLVLALEQKRTGGYAVALESLELQQDVGTLTVVVRIDEPGPDMNVIQMLSRPFAVYRLKLPSGESAGQKPIKLSLRFLAAQKDKQKLEFAPLALK